MLKRLNHLDIQGNMFEGRFPNAMKQLENLTFLFMGNNPMLTPAPVPSWIFELKSTLRELGLSNMGLTNDVPFWMETLEHLIFLDMSHNALTGDVPKEVFDLPELTYFLLHNNTLTGQIPTDIVGAEKLQMLTLYDNDFSGDVNHVCDESPILELLAVDCTLTCSEECCPSCCDRTAKAGVDAFCYNQAVPTYLQFFEGLWELNYTRAKHSFDPALITDDPLQFSP